MFILGLICGIIAGSITAIFTLAICKASGRCPYQNQDGSCDYLKEGKIRDDRIALFGEIQ